MLTADTVLQNRYRVVRPLGHGGMGAVYEAVDERVNALVALKEAYAGASGESRREFEREAGLLANLQHQSLPKVMDYFVEGTGEYLVMEYIPGYDLAELLARRGAPFHINLVLRWADELLDLLEYLHGLKPAILHRDIKPSNLKLTQREDIYLLDFGLAKGAAGKMRTHLGHGSVRGFTPFYASVEQIMGQGTDARSDLYSLGATLYHLLTGAPPVDAPTRDEQMEDGKPDPLLPMQKLNPAVPAGVASVIHQALSVRRRNRPESAAAMRAALRQAGEESKRAAQIAAPPTRPGAPQQALQTRPVAGDRTAQPWQGNAGDYNSGPGPGRSSGFSRKAIIAITLGAILAAIVAVVAITVSRRRAARSRRAAEVEATSSPAPPRQEVTENVGGVQLEMIMVPGGTFKMGASETEARRALDEARRVDPKVTYEMLGYELPEHDVTVPAFYIGKYEVTQAQWRAVARLPKEDRYLDPNPSNFRGDTLPVDTIAFEDAVEFCNRLSRRTGKTYRLPSEAEWEYACRAGTTTSFSFGDSLSPEQANFHGDFPYGDAPKGVNRERTTPVGSFNPNDFGLYDMHGNVWEWCLDVQHPNYNGAPSDGSAWVTGGDSRYRIVRGGSWDYYAYNARSSFRGRIEAYFLSPSIGFRVVLVAGAQGEL